MKFYKSPLFKITLLSNVRQTFSCNKKLPQIPVSCGPNKNNMTQWIRISCKVTFLRIHSIGGRDGLLCLTHLGRVTQICVFTLQLCKMDDANLRF